MRSPRRLAGDYLVLSAGEFVAKLAGLVAFAYLARRLGPQTYGLVELTVALAMVFSLLVDFGLGPIGAREVARRRGSAADLTVGIPAARLALAVVAGLGMLGCAFLLDLPAMARLLVVLYGCSLFVAPWNLNWLFQGLGLMHIVAPAQAIRMLVFAFGAVFLVSSAQDIWKVGVAELVAASVMAGYFVLLQKRYLPSASVRPKLRAVRSLLSEALPVGLSRVVWALNQYLPTVVLAYVVGGSEVGWFVAAHRVATSAGSFVFLYHFNLFPRIAQLIQGRQKELDALFRVSFRSASWLGVLVAFAGTLLSGPVCRLVFGEEFETAARSLSVLVWLVPLTLLGTHARFALIACGRQKMELGANVIGLAVLLLASVPAAGRWGSMGAAAAMLLSSMATWTSAHVLARSHLVHLPFVRPLVKPLALSGIALVSALLLRGLGSWISTGVGLGLFVAMALVLEPTVRSDLLSLLNRQSEPNDRDEA